MFNKKQLYLIGSLALALSLVLVQVQVKAAWTNPIGGPSGTDTNPPLTNPLKSNLNLDGWDITSASSTASTDITGIHDLQVTNNLTVTKINNQTPSFGGLSNPLTEDIDGADRYAIKKLKGCDPESGKICGAIKGQAGRSTKNDTYAAGLYGYTQASSGAYPSYAVYGDALNAGGIAMYGVARDMDGVGGKFINAKAGGKALVTNGLTELNGNLTVVGNADVSNMLNGQGAVFSGNVEVKGTTYMEGFVTVANGANIQGPFRVDISPVSLDSAIVGNANGTNYDINAGVEGQGTVGVYGDGHLVGIFGISPGYGGIFKGDTQTGWGPLPGGGMDGSGLDDVAHDFITGLFGVEKTWAGLDIAGAVGVVAAGGWSYASGFSNAGLGICALSGEKAHYVDTTTGDFQAYCKSGTANNFSGFFAGDIYVKEGSIQLNDTLVVAGENLIYGNIDATSVAGSSLLKLQTGGVDKFRVDKDGNLTASNFYVDSTNNRVGIGTSAPTDLFVVNGVARFTNTVKLADGTLANTSLAHRADENTGMYFPAVDNISFVTNSNARLTINNNGYVVLGSPKILDFNDGANSGPTCDNSNNGVLYYFATSKAFCACDGSSWKSLINSKADNQCSNNPF